MPANEKHGMVMKGKIYYAHLSGVTLMNKSTKRTVQEGKHPFQLVCLDHSSTKKGGDIFFSSVWTISHKERKRDFFEWSLCWECWSTEFNIFGTCLRWRRQWASGGHFVFLFCPKFTHFWRTISRAQIPLVFKQLQLNIINCVVFEENSVVIPKTILKGS